MSEQKRRILMTTALPYANGDIHLGHVVEHIQADMWAHFQRLRGNDCRFVCADDTHGTPVMLAAQKAGVAPEQMIERTRKRHVEDLTAFGVAYDNYYTTHSRENKELSAKLYLELKKKGMIERRSIKQLYDPEKQMFLSDRFVKGTCPRCKAEGQYGDNCDHCGATYKPTELIDPRSAISGATPELRESEHLFFRLSACEAFLREWMNGEETLADGTKAKRLQPESLNKMSEWLGSLTDWDISRDAPYFGFPIPEEEDKYFYVWLDAPVGYFASFKNFCERSGLDYEEYIRKGSPCEMVHFVGKDILYFHSLFWPAMLNAAGLRAPTGVFAHGFLTLNGQKMSKSKGTFITARAYRDSGLDPECLRYYFASKLNGTSEDIDLNLEDFVARFNSDVVGKYLNIASRSAPFLVKRFGGKTADVSSSGLVMTLRNSANLIAGYFEKRDTSKAIKEIMALADMVNEYADMMKPWELAKDESKAEELAEACSVLIECFRILTIYLSPVMPKLAKNARLFLNVESLDWGALRAPLAPGHEILPYKHLMGRIDPKAARALVSAPAADSGSAEGGKKGQGAPAKEAKAAKAAAQAGQADQEGAGQAENCTIDDFAKLDLRVAKVLACEAVPGSKKLLKFDLDMGETRRTVFSGIKGSYGEPEKLVGGLVIVLANLKPRRMADFGYSQGMILSAAGEDGGLFLLRADDGAAPGMRVG